MSMSEVVKRFRSDNREAAEGVRGKVMGPAKNVLFTKQDIKYIEDELPHEKDGVALTIVVYDGSYAERGSTPM